MKEESWEEFQHTCYRDNGKQEGFVAFLLMTFTKKSMFKNRVNRAILPKTKRLPVCGTHGICGMSTYDPLRVAPSDLFGQRKEAVTGGKNRFTVFFLGKNRSTVYYSIN